MLIRNPRIVGINRGMSVPAKLLPARVEPQAQGWFPVGQLVACHRCSERARPDMTT